MTLTFAGLSTEPLGAYLKALGVFRVLAEQADPDASAWWSDGLLSIETTLTRNEVYDFFLDSYRPAPVAAPWNRGSGLRKESKSPQAEATMRAIEWSEHPRLEQYRATIAAARRIEPVALRNGWEDKKDKRRWVELCRATFPDPALPWLDVAAVVVEDDRVAFPPVSGSGGVFGRLDLSITYAQRLIDVLGLGEGRRAPGRTESEAWLRGSLDGAAVKGKDVSVGHFSPGASGGAGTSAFDDNRGVVNPWDVVLLVEGMLLFASSLTRRNGAERHPKAATPFMVAASPVGHPTGTGGETSRGELWAPLWGSPMGVAELRHLFGEGRARWNGRQARTGLDFAQAAASLGTDRGIHAYVRYAIVERFGQSDFAIPAGLHRVDASSTVPVVEPLDRWMDRVRGVAEPPASLTHARRAADEALFRLTQGADPARLQEVLVAAAKVEDVLAASSSLRKERSPVAGLKAGQWLQHLDDGSPEFRLATAIASHPDTDGMWLREMLTHAALDRDRHRWVWSESGPTVAGLDVRHVVTVLAEALRRRAVAQTQSKRESEQEGEKDRRKRMPAGIPAPLHDVAGLATGQAIDIRQDGETQRRALDERRLARLLRGMLLLDWASWQRSSQETFTKPVPAASASARHGEPGPRALAYSVLAPFFHRESLRPLGWPADEKLELRPHAEWPAQIHAGYVDRVCDSAIRRMRAESLDPIPLRGELLAASVKSPHHLAAALMCPISTKSANGLLAVVCPKQPDPTSSNAEEQDEQDERDENPSAAEGEQQP